MSGGDALDGTEERQKWRRRGTEGEDIHILKTREIAMEACSHVPAVAYKCTHDAEIPSVHSMAAASRGSNPIYE